MLEDIESAYQYYFNKFRRPAVSLEDSDGSPLGADGLYSI